MTEDWVQEPDDVPWSEAMRWSPEADIVPFRPEESLAWRLEALRRDVVQLRQETVARAGDNVAQLRRLGLLTGGLRDLAEVNDRIVAERPADDRVDAAGYTADSISFPHELSYYVSQATRRRSRILDVVARHALELDPGCTMESRISPDGTGEDIRILLSTGDYVPSETVAEWVREAGGEVLAVNVDPAPVSTLGDSIRSTPAAARSLADVLRDVAPDLSTEWLDQVPLGLIDAVERGEGPATVRLQGGQEVELRHRHGQLEAYLVEHTWEGWPWSDAPAHLTVGGHLDPADYVALMGVLNPPPPTPDTFLAQMIRDQQERHTPPLPGIQSGEALPGESDGSPRPRPTARDMVHRYRDRWGRLLEVRWYSGDGDPGVYVEVTGSTPQDQARSLLPADLDLPAGATVAQVISAAKDRYVPELGVVQLCVCPYCQPPGVAPAATDVEPRLYNPSDYRYRSMFDPEESAAFLARVQERYREVTGMPWPMPGTGADPFREPAAASGGEMERVLRMYENAAGQPFGTERVGFAPSSTRYESWLRAGRPPLTAEPRQGGYRLLPDSGQVNGRCDQSLETDVRGGHM